MTKKLSFDRIEFLISAAKLQQLPADIGSEVAFVGRSNAGKSTAINKITARKNLARTSKDPGRTQLINFFTLDDQHRLVDLPGYGYAKVPIEMKERWQQTLHSYLTQRHSLRGIFLIMDSRHPMTQYDEQLIGLFEDTPLNLHILLSKADKLSNNEMKKTLQTVSKKIAGYNLPISVQLFSAKSNLGVAEAQEKLIQLLQTTTPSQ